MSLKITDLIQGIEGLVRTGDKIGNPAVTGLTEDSREVKNGFVFVAVKGAKFDGTAFIPKAISLGASAILVESDVKVDAIVPILVHPNPRYALGMMAAKFYAPEPETIIAVTGTNGKTSTVHFCRQLWHLMGKKSASMGTLGVLKGMATHIDDTVRSMTTPPNVFLHKALHDLAAEGVTHVAMETSSHGLDQARVAGVPYKVGAFTNFTRDHLDYHGTEANYFDAKMKLFTVAMEKGAAVINADIPEYKKIEKICLKHSHRVYDFGFKAKYMKLVKITPQPSGQRVEFTYDAKTHIVNLPLVGAFQVSNLLCAAMMLIAAGEDAGSVIAQMEKVLPVTGRLDKAGDHPSGASIYIDYAHTPDALEKVLEALRPHVAGKGKLKVLFGCGGDRDKGKRPEMGKLACRLADEVIVTDDNPRTEVAATIRKEIMAACDAKATEVAGREEAMKQAIRSLQKGDVLLLAGKGHEKYQIIGEKTLPFDEVEITTKLLQNLR
ncbi:MAG: UDP-N-acetylmuramoyl-L-alanyl-D-glutamate--2,6-diaminopimelate ligase [Proteobacteria bacterium]|nr:UDP-N-acetylmuramoyl-L-alanyl-D-glutamate--2,6-diaminopimelate ligase [Pseudomonadota bacterium]